MHKTLPHLELVRYFPELYSPFKQYILCQRDFTHQGEYEICTYQSNGQAMF